MVQEPDDRNRLLQLRLEFRDQRHGVGVIQIEDQQAGTIGLRRIGDARYGLLVGGALHELDFDAELLRSLLDLGLEKQVIDEAEDARGSVVANRNRRRRSLVELRIIAAVAVAR